MTWIRSIVGLEVACCVVVQAFAAAETITVSTVEEFATALLHMNTNCAKDGSAAARKDTIILKTGSYDVTDLNLQCYGKDQWVDSGANFGISYFKIKGATDIRGDAAYPRLRDGKADVGCYQCWLDQAGTRLSIR